MSRNILFYEGRLVLGLASLLPALVLPLYALLATLVWLTHQTGHLEYELRQVFVFLLPLNTGLIAAHLMAVEREEGFDDLRRSYPEADWRIPLLRTACALSISVVSALTALAIVALTSRAASIEFLLLSLPASLFLLGLALLLNNISGSYPLTTGVIVAYWFIDFQTGGHITRHFFLFNAVRPRMEVDQTLNDALLIGCGLLFMLANAEYTRWRRRMGG